jgi:hypothetical protein
MRKITMVAGVLLAVGLASPLAAHENQMMIPGTDTPLVAAGATYAGNYNGWYGSSTTLDPYRRDEWHRYHERYRRHEMRRRTWRHEHHAHE